MWKWLRSLPKNDWFRFIITLLIMWMVAWWLRVVVDQINTAPKLATTTTDGYDPYSRAKDILVILIPIMTTAFGYWFGVAGKNAAEKQAEAAGEQAAQSGAQLTAILATGPSDLLANAMATYPNSFGLPSGSGPAPQPNPAPQANPAP